MFLVSSSSSTQRILFLAIEVVAIAVISTSQFPPYVCIRAPTSNRAFKLCLSAYEAEAVISRRTKEHVLPRCALHHDLCTETRMIASPDCPHFEKMRFNLGKGPPETCGPEHHPKTLVSGRPQKTPLLYRP